MTLLRTFTVIFALIATNSLFGQKTTSTLESTNYDSQLDETTYTSFPLGSLTMPGKWIKISYNKISGQYNFKNIDSVSSALAINKASVYPFYKRKMTANTFIKEMYEWDSQYMVARIKGIRSIIEHDTTTHFIIWRITDTKEIHNIDTYYLFGCENNILYSVMLDTDKWSQGEKVAFMKKIYSNKKIGKCCD
jgi:hypothetical protein